MAMNEPRMCVGSSGVGTLLPEQAMVAGFTRHSPSFVAKFAAEGRYSLIPLYFLLRLSDFAREGMDHSGSYRFADHMYRNVASGRGWLGRCIDRLLLSLPTTKSMRQRYVESRDSMFHAFKAHLATGSQTKFRILTAPCGIPRDVREFAAQIAAEDPALLDRVEYTGIDIDAEAIASAEAFLADSGIQNPRLIVGDALTMGEHPGGHVDYVASTGFGEFLDDYTLAVLYRKIFDTLAPGGAFFTSAAARSYGADWLLRTFEFEIRYRTSSDLERVLALQPWKTVEFTTDRAGRQTFVRAVKR